MLSCRPPTTKVRVCGSSSLMLPSRRWAGSRRAICGAKVGRAEPGGCARRCHPSVDGKAQLMDGQSAFVCRVCNFRKGDGPDAAASLYRGPLCCLRRLGPQIRSAFSNFPIPYIRSACISKTAHFNSPNAATARYVSRRRRGRAIQASTNRYPVIAARL